MNNDELLHKIYSMRRGFSQEYRIAPNTLYLGYDEYCTIKKGNPNNFNTGNDQNDEKLFGMAIERIAKDNHISLGLTIKL